MKRSEAAVVLAIKVAAAVVTYGFVMLLARMMQPADFGIVGALLTGSLLLSVAGMIGQHTALLRFVPPLRKLEGDGAPATRQMIDRAFTLGLAGMVLLTGALALALIAADLAGLREVRWPVLAGLALIPLVGWIDLQAHLARAWRSVMLALVPKEILWRALVLAGCAAAYGLGGGAALPLGTVVALMIGVLVVLILGQGGVMGRTMPRPRLDRASLKDTPQDWRRSVVPFWVNGVASMFLTNADVVIVALMLGGEPAAYYFAANRLAMLCHFFMMSHNIVVGPQVSAAWHAGDRDKVQAMVRRATWQAFVPTAIAAAGIALFATPILTLFGPEFIAGQPVLHVLLLTTVVSAALGPATLVLDMSGHERYSIRINAMLVVLAVPVLFLAAFVGGGTGVAFGVLFLMSLLRIVAAVVLHKVAQVRSDVGWTR